MNALSGERLSDGLDKPLQSFDEDHHLIDLMLHYDKANADKLTLTDKFVLGAFRENLWIAI